MALNSNALVSLAETKVYLGIPSGETSQDSLVEGFINACSFLVEKYCNRKFIQGTYTERYNGVGVTEIQLNQWPITSITSIHVDSRRSFGSDTLIDASNYEVFDDENAEGFVVERFDSTFPRGRKNVQVVYVAGYADIDSVPNDLKLGTKIAIAFYYEQQQQKNWTFSNKQKVDENITLVQGLPESSTLILDNYKRTEMIAPVEPIRNL